MAFESFNHNKKNMFAYYKVGNKKFYSDVKALEELSKLTTKIEKNDQHDLKLTLLIDDLALYMAKKGALEFCIDQKMMNDDWTVEPPETIEYYRQQMCAYIEKNYDEITIGYSGGTDSNTVVECFKRRKTPNIKLLNVVNNSVQQLSKTRQYLNDHTKKVTYAKHGRAASELGWEFDLFQGWTPTSKETYEKEVVDYEYGAWDSDWKNTNGWYQNSGELTLTRSKTSKACFIMGYEKPEILIEDGWYVYKLHNYEWDLPINCTDPNVDLIYFYVNDGSPDLIKKLSHAKAKEIDNILWENNLPPTTESMEMFKIQHSTPYYDRLMRAMGFEAASPFLQGIGTKIQGEWYQEDKKCIEENNAKDKQTVQKQKIANDYFDNVITKKVHHKFLDLKNRNIKGIWGKPIRVRPVSQRLLDRLKK
tara:strand:+ start:366 stop:1625 length:1260 start_codon:yes stop_codon:yes gene_type:complete